MAIKSALGLKRKEIDAVEARIITKDFEHAVWCEQDSESPGHAVFHEELSGVSPDCLFDADFNEVFHATFDEMVLSPKRDIDVDGLIDAIEDLQDPNLTVQYQPGEDGCVVTIHATRVTLHVTAKNVRVEVCSRMNPEQLVSALEQSRNKMIELAGPSVRLLS